MRAADGGENRNPAETHRLDAASRDGRVAGGALTWIACTPLRFTLVPMAMPPAMISKPVALTVVCDVKPPRMFTAPRPTIVSNAPAPLCTSSAPLLTMRGVLREAAGIEHGQPA